MEVPVRAVLPHGRRREDEVAVSNGSIDVRISPGFRRWQAVLLATVLVASLLVGFVMGRVTTPPAGAAGPPGGVDLVWGHVVDHGPQAHMGQMHRDRAAIRRRAR
jgi:hypothetical protein